MAGARAWHAGWAARTEGARIQGCRWRRNLVTWETALQRAPAVHSRTISAVRDEREEGTRVRRNALGYRAADVGCGGWCAP